MTLAVKAYEEKARDQWLFDYPAQVWRLTHIFLFAMRKIIHLHLEQTNDPILGKHKCASLLPGTPLSWSQTLDGLFELKRQPFKDS